MNKRLLSLILSVAFILGCFSAASVSASTITLTDDDYSKSAEILGAICPGFPLVDEEVTSDAKPTTRAEFVAAIAMVMNVDVKSGVETPFSDVSKKHEFATAIKYAANAGLISTVDLFYPDSPITFSQALKIAMVAAGYGDKAEYTGGYPTGYIKAAKEAGVAQNLNLSATDTLTHDQAAQIIFDAAVCDMLEVTSFGDSFDYSTTQGKNILSVFKKVYIANGIVEENENTNITNSEKSCGDDTIIVGGMSFYAPGYENYIGKNVRLFYGNDNKNTVITGYENLNNIYTYTNDDYLKISGLTLTVSPADANKDVRYNLENDYSVIYNGKFYGSADYNSVINPTAGSVSLIDNDDNGIIDVIVIKSVEYGIIGSVNEFDEKIYDKYKRNGLIDLTNGGNAKYFVAEADGTAIELHDLESDDVVGYAISKDRKLIEVIHYTERVGGTLDAKTSDGKIEVKGKAYPLSTYYTTNVKTINGIKFGSQVILHLGVGGQVVYVEEFTSSMQYGVFVAAAQTSGISGENIVLIYGTDGAMHQYSVSDKIKFNGSPLAESSVSSTLEALEGQEAVLRVIKYSLDANGKVNKIFSAKENTDGPAHLLAPVTEESQPVLYSRNAQEEQGGGDIHNGHLMYLGGTFFPLFHLGATTGVIQVPLNEAYRTDKDYYATHTTTTLADAKNQNFYGYDVHNGTASFVLWTKDGSGAQDVGEIASAVIESVTQGLNEDGEPVKVFKAYMNKKWIKFYSKASYNATETELKNTIDTIKPGDIVQVALDDKNVISAASINFSYIDDKFINAENDNNDYSAKIVGFETGYLLTMADKKAILVRNVPNIADVVSGNYSIINTVAAPFNKGAVVFLKFNRSKQTGEILDAVVYTESDVNVAESVYNSGANADYVVQRSRYGAVALTVIYTN